jgi:hypothetical protein
MILSSSNMRTGAEPTPPDDETLDVRTSKDELMICRWPDDCSKQECLGTALPFSV